MKFSVNFELFHFCVKVFRHYTRLLINTISFLLTVILVKSFLQQFFFIIFVAFNDGLWHPVWNSNGPKRKQWILTLSTQAKYKTI